MKVKKSELDRITRFMLEADKLKTVDRTGWVMRRVPKPESDGDHSYSVALLSYIMAGKLGLDADKCMIMALIHDIGEVITGDIATRADERKQKVSKAEKAVMDHESTIAMLSYLDRQSRSGLLDIWKEFEDGKSEEAELVHQVDKLDQVLQLIPYSRYIKKDEYVEEFFETARRRITMPELLYIYGKIRKQVYSERGK